MAIRPSKYDHQSQLINSLPPRHRIHPLAGVVEDEDPQAMARAEETYVKNMQYAADKCAEVSSREWLSEVLLCI